MREYAMAKTRAAVDAFLEALDSASRLPDAASVHLLRVSIRRLQQCLRVFAQYLPERGTRKLRKRLSTVKDSAGEMRNHDIAIALMKKLDGNSNALRKQRVEARRDLDKTLRQMARQDLALRCRKWLQLEAE